MLIVMEWGAILLVALFIITQILVPTFNNRPMVPMFRRERVLKNKLTELKQKEFEQQLEAVVERQEHALEPVAKPEAAKTEVVTQ